MDIKEIGRTIGQASRCGRDLAALLFVLESQKEDSCIDEITLAENADLFPVWDENFTGGRGTIVQDEGLLFRAIHDVGVGQNTKPSETPSMWTQKGNPGEEFPQWIQPIGVHDAYPAGARVTHNELRWVSDVDSNIWEPGIFGWTQVD